MAINQFVARNGIISLNDAQITGSLYITTNEVINGSSTAVGGYTGSLLGTASTASYVTTAQTASYVLNAISSSFASTSNNANTASYVLNSVSSSFASTASYITTAQTASYVLNAISSSYAYTSSYANTFTVAGTLTAQTIVVQTITSSIDYSSGSNIFGNSLSNTQTFTGSIGATGSFTLVGNQIITGSSTSTLGYTGSLFGTASYSSYSTSPIAITGSSIYSNTLTSNVNSVYGVSFGLNAGNGSDTNTYNSNFIGFFAGYNSINSFYTNNIGSQAGQSSMYSYGSNFIGYSAGYQSSGSYYSNFIGYAAGYQSSASQQSNFIGYLAGYQASGSQLSNFIGYTAGDQTIGSIYSNFIGFGAGAAAFSSYYSNFIGSQAGKSVTSSYSNLIGYQAGYSINTSSSIGNNNIIIGTNVTLSSSYSNGINIGGILFGSGTYSTTTGNPSSGSAGGKIGINQPNPQYTLDVSGSGNFTGAVTALGTISTTSDVIAYNTSDNRFKTNVTPIKNPIDKIKQISGVEFDWIPHEEYHSYKGHDVGVIAQEIEKVLPEVVTTRDNGYKAVKYDKIVSLLIEAIKDQQQQIDELKSLLNK